MAVALIGPAIVNVCIEDALRRTAETQGSLSPMSLVWNELATTTPSSIQSACRKATRRYAGFIGTLAPLWQRQNDVNSALAAQRRTTAASPTRVAASQIALVVIAFRFTLLWVSRVHDDIKRAVRCQPSAVSNQLSSLFN
jgi:hypothetical protein